MRPKNTPNDPERRDRIVVAAMGLIAEGGCAAITARAVAERAAVPVGSVSYHFASVKALLLEAARRVADERAASLAQWACSAADGGESGLADSLARLIHCQLTEGRELTAASYELALAGIHDIDLRSVALSVENALEEAIAAAGRGVPDIDPAAVASLAEGLQLRSLLLAEPPSLEELQKSLSAAIPR